MKTNIFTESTPTTIHHRVLDFMLENIGNSNPYVRDEIIYRAWCYLFDKGRIDIRQKRKILSFLLDEKYLSSYDFDNSQDLVLRRSFTALLLVILLEDERKNCWMTADNYQRIMQESFSWLLEEQDYRGFDEKLGWIHAFAHGADLLVEIVRLTACQVKEVNIIMSILTKIISSQDILLWSEEDRLSVVIIELLKLKKLSESELLYWCENIEKSLNSWQAHKKWSVFVQTLFFKLNFENIMLKDINHYIEEYLTRRYRNSHGTLL